MKGIRLVRVGVAAAATAAVVLGAAGAASGANATNSTHAVNGGTATVDMGSPPNSLDPQSGYTVPAGEADWIVYTPLLTYAHKSGLAGTQLIPGLASALPKITNGGKTYTLTLRPGLKYSNNAPVMAADFAYAIERALKLNWGASSFLDPIQGTAAFLSGKAKSISGIQTDNATGKITIHLSSAVGAFSNVLAFPATSPVPSTTPMTNQVTTLPPGVGAYMIQKVVPNVSFQLVKNPIFASFHIPGIPTGHLDEIDVHIVSNNLSEAEAVLDNQADAFDVGDTIPATLLGQIQSKAADRFAKEVVASTSYIFLNQRIAPFNNQLAREAATMAVNRDALARLAGGFVTPSCYFLPVGIPGHPTAPCVYKSPDIAKAKALLKQANLVGSKISVYGFAQSPQQQEAQYYANALQQVGFKVSLKLVNPAIYWTTIGNAKTRPNTGEAGQFLDFPNPSDFYLLLDARSIHPVKSNNFGNVDDPHIQATLKRLEAVPATKLNSVAKQWTALDVYTAKKAYDITWGSNELVKFFSDRINFKTAVFQPLFFNDWSTWELNS